MAKTTASEDTKTEAEKGGKDPVGKPIEPGPKVETNDDQGIGARDPYPTGKGRDPEADFEAAHGFKRAKE